MTNLKNLNKYLDNYAEPECQSLSGFSYEDHFEHCVVIPAYKEEACFVKRLFIQNPSKKLLLVLVVNQPSYETNATPQESLISELNTFASLAWQQDNLSFYQLNQNDKQGILIVDRFTVPIPEKSGVGLARKIGADLALTLHQKNIVISKWLHSTDADASLPKDYFLKTTNSNKNTIAACYNFNHSSNDKLLNQANALYEKALRYYVAGLSYAGSPYNFFTIGSVICFKFEGYVAVRGFPKKSAGEDFYLLNKLAKLGQVAWFSDSVVELVARESDRVPFGTGPAVTKILDLFIENKPYCYYHPEIFDELKTVLTHFSKLYAKLDNLDSWITQLSPISQKALEQIGFYQFVEKQKKSSEKQFSKQLGGWFDAFKTLKFIHALKEIKYFDVPLEQAISQANFSL